MFDVCSHKKNDAALKSPARTLNAEHEDRPTKKAAATTEVVETGVKE